MGLSGMGGRKIYKRRGTLPGKSTIGEDYFSKAVRQRGRGGSDRRSNSEMFKEASPLAKGAAKQMLQEVEDQASIFPFEPPKDWPRRKKESRTENYGSNDLDSERNDIFGRAQKKKIKGIVRQDVCGGLRGKEDNKAV